MSFTSYIKKNNLGTIDKKTTFKQLTTMKVGGRIKYVYYPTSIKNLKLAINYLINKKIKYLFIGNGSNIVASERKFRGVVIHSKKLPHTMNIEDDVITVSAFYDLRRLVSFTSERDINTFTNLAGIPATVGGAIYMNASANNTAISDNLISVSYLCNNRIIKKRKEELSFNYRYSEFMSKDCIILEASFKINIKKDIIVDYRKCLEQRRKNHPIIFPNSGSIFRNPYNKKAYEIIEELELNGYTEGKAQVSMKHCNFIINTGNAKGEDIYKIIKKIQSLAKKNEYILKEEVILFNFKKEKSNISI